MNHFVDTPPKCSLISHVFINIHERLNLICYELDQFGNFGSADPPPPLDFSHFFIHLELLFSLKLMIFFIIYLIVKVQRLSIELALGLIH